MAFPRDATADPLQLLGSQHSSPQVPMPQGNSAARTRVHNASSRRRDKPQLSCNACRQRKARCDRLLPCSNCFSRGQTCAYPDNIIEPTLASTASVHERLLRLERQIVSLANKAGTSSECNRDSFERAASSNDHAHVLAGSGIISSSPDLSYVDSNHWANILASIDDLKAIIENNEQPTAAVPAPYEYHAAGGGTTGTRQHALLLYGSPRRFSRAEIIAALPSRATVDRYVSQYFHCGELVSATIHGPTFLREYENFWADSESASIMWLGLLFGMISLAVLSLNPNDAQPRNDSERRSWLQVEPYRETIVQCLIQGEYTTPGPLVVEAFIHYQYVEFLTRSDANKDVWCLCGLGVQLALRSGFHRDPSRFPGVSPYKSEMWRRIWATVVQSDVLLSNQMGMPRMVQEWQCDTAEPRNLNDADFDQNTIELPSSRAESEVTTTLSTIARARMLTAIGSIASLTGQIRSCNHAEIMRADAKLREAAKSIPPPFQAKSTTASITDSPQVIMSRLFISHLFFKGQIMLHHRFALTKSPDQDGDPTASSQKVCLEACLGMIGIQKVLDEETRPGGRLQAMRWRVTSLINHQFLTATMILCSLLHRQRTMGRNIEIIAALESTQAIWIRSIGQSQEAETAARAIAAVLVLAGSGESPRCSHSQGLSAPPEEADGESNENIDVSSSHLGAKQASGMPLADIDSIFMDQSGSNLGFDFNSFQGDDNGLNEWIMSPISPVW